MAKKYTAIRENILIRVFNGETVTKGGIVIPGIQDHDMKRDEAEVIGIGPHAFYETGDIEVSIGDTIAIPKYAGKVLETKQNGDQIRVIKDTDVLCRIEEIEEVKEDVR